MNPATYVLLAAGATVWAAPFPLFRTSTPSFSERNRTARWGVALQCIGYSLLWQGSFWMRSQAAWQVALSIVLFSAASLVSWTGARALGRHFRVDAALNSTHELIQTGPYRWVRHPIYLSMLCVFLASAFALSTPLYLLVPAILLFAAGTAIRVRVEDRLLEARFGTTFQTYRDRVPAIIPIALRKGMFGPYSR